METSACSGIRVVTPGKLEELKNAVRAYAVALADGPGRWADEAAVKDQLVRGRLDTATIFSAYAEAVQASRGKPGSRP